MLLPSGHVAPRSLATSLLVCHVSLHPAKHVPHAAPETSHIAPQRLYVFHVVRKPPHVACRGAQPHVVGAAPNHAW